MTGEWPSVRCHHDPKHFTPWYLRAVPDSDRPIVSEIDCITCAVAAEREACAQIGDSAEVYFRTLANIEPEGSLKAKVLNAARQNAEDFAAAIRARP